MSKVRIPPVLRKETGGARDVETSGETVGQVLRDLVQQYPSLDGQLYDNQELRKYVNVYVNDQDIQYLSKLETPVGPADTVVILPAMAGGTG